MQRHRKTGFEKKLDSLRRASLGQRKRTAFLLSLSVTLVVASVWATVIFPKTFLLGEQNVASGAQASAPLERFREDAGLILNDLQNGFSEVKELSAGLFSQLGAGAGVEAANEDATEEENAEYNEMDSIAPTRNDMPLKADTEAETESASESEDVPGDGGSEEEASVEASNDLQMDENMVQ